MFQTRLRFGFCKNTFSNEDFINCEFLIFISKQTHLFDYFKKRTDFGIVQQDIFNRKIWIKLCLLKY